jgi:predicted nucleic acid-binding protein
MHTLLDTNVLLRSSQPSSPHHFIATAAVNALLDANRVLCISSQTIYEFLAVATRSLAENGLAMKQADADAQLTALLAGFEVLYDSFAVASELRRLMIAHQIVGKKIHDARLVATMSAHNISELLTFNDADFKRFAHITLLSTDDVARGRLPAAPPETS